jgi:positive regulator of sigma E activity
MQRWIGRSGLVVEHDGQRAVEFDPACSGAGAGCGACGTRSPAMSLALLNLDQAARTGDRVDLRVAAGSLNRIAAACFAMPLAALLAGAGIGGCASAGTRFDADVASGVVGLCCLAVALAIITRSGSPLLRMLKLTARLERTNT